MEVEEIYTEGFREGFRRAEDCIKQKMIETFLVFDKTDPDFTEQRELEASLRIWKACRKEKEPELF